MKIIPKVALIQNTVATRKNLTLFSDVVKLFASEEIFDVIVINLTPEMADMTIKAIRRNKRYRFTLVYSLSAKLEYSDYFNSLSDGVIPPSVPEVADALNKVTERLRMFNNGQPPETFDRRVMAWLWMRGDANIVPVRNPNRQTIYEYPLLECLAEGEKVNFFSWLNMFKERGMFDAHTLKNRLRLCTDCGSSRLNYVDVCPECNDMDIERKSAIHCFTCGHVGCTDTFVVNGIMSCPKCKTRLRHVGSDYDRPMENYSCNSCNAFFVDAKVVAQCNDCTHTHDSSELKIQPIRSYELSEKGRLHCRNGFDYEQQIADHFTKGCFVGPARLYEFVDWHLQMAQRYKDFQFSLIGIRLVHLEKIIDRFGQLKGHTLIDALVDRINVMFRETDRGARCQEDCLWIALPNTDLEGLEHLKKRISQIPKMFPSEALKVLEMRVIGHTISYNRDNAGETAELLIARLYTDLED